VHRVVIIPKFPHRLEKPAQSNRHNTRKRCKQRNPKQIPGSFFQTLHDPPLKSILFRAEVFLMHFLRFKQLTLENLVFYGIL
jgi:hypothetical protein